MSNGSSSIGLWAGPADVSVNGGGDGGVSTRVRSFPVLGVGGSSGGETGASRVVSGLGGSPMIITGADGAAIPTL